MRALVSGLSDSVTRVGVAAAHLALRIDCVIRQLQPIVVREPQVAPSYLDAEQHRRIGRGALERRRKHLHRQAADRQRAVERVLDFRCADVLGVDRRRFRLLRRDVRLPGAHRQSWPRDAHVDLVHASRPRIRRVVSHHVVRAVVADDAVVGGVEVVLVHDRESARLLRQNARASPATAGARS